MVPILGNTISRKLRSSCKLKCIHVLCLLGFGFIGKRASRITQQFVRKLHIYQDTLPTIEFNLRSRVARFLSVDRADGARFQRERTAEAAEKPAL